jgi:hypothetical protein
MNEFAQARDERIIQVFGKADDYPCRFRLEQGPAERDIFMKLIANAQIFCSGFNGSLVDNAIPLQGMHVSNPYSGSRLYNWQEQRAANGEIA